MTRCPPRSVRPRSRALALTAAGAAGLLLAAGETRAEGSCDGAVAALCGVVAPVEAIGGHLTVPPSWPRWLHRLQWRAALSMSPDALPVHGHGPRLPAPTPWALSLSVQTRLDPWWPERWTGPQGAPSGGLSLALGARQADWSAARLTPQLRWGQPGDGSWALRLRGRQLRLQYALAWGS